MAEIFTTQVNTVEADEQNLLQMLEQFRQGNISARDEILRAHYEIVKRVSKKRARLFSLSSDDVYSDALMLLFEALERAREKLDSKLNISAYLVSSVVKGLRFPQMSRKGVLFDNDTKPKHRYLTNPIRLSTTAKVEEPSLEFLEILESIAKNPREKQIIELRKQSHNYEEIAEILGISPSSVCLCMQDLTNRFDQLYDL